VSLTSIRKFENFHIALWLVKDTCWVMDVHVLGMIMIVPTLALAFYITWKFRQNVCEMMHNSAVCMWITANSIWMTGEFFFNDSFRPYALVFFAAGLITIAWYYLFMLKPASQKLEEAPSEIAAD
jgi:hypothetical protein